MQQAAADGLIFKTRRQPLPAAAWFAQLGRPRVKLCSQRLQPTLASKPRQATRQLTFLGLGPASFDDAQCPG